MTAFAYRVHTHTTGTVVWGKKTDKDSGESLLLGSRSPQDPQVCSSLIFFCLYQNELSSHFFPCITYFVPSPLLSGVLPDCASSDYQTGRHARCRVRLQHHGQGEYPRGRGHDGRNVQFLYYGIFGVPNPYYCLHEWHGIPTVTTSRLCR